LVVSMHAAVTYSNVGSWYYTEKARLATATLFLLATYQAFLQAFFMAILFLVAGFFVPPACDRKGPAAFLRDRAFRLGLPTVLYMFLIGPLTEYYVAGSWRPRPPSSFAIQWVDHIRDGEFLSASGPLWFCVALLIFCFVYATFRVVRGTADEPSTGSDVLPGNAVLWCFILVMAACTFLVRLVQPSGSSFFNLQLADFSQYVLMFIAGIVAYRRNWLTRFPYRRGLRWLTLGATVGFALWLAILIFGGAFKGNLRVYGGGWYWQSAAFVLWESFVCVAICAGLTVLYRAKLNCQGRIAKFLSDNAFCVYVFHPPIVIGAARLLHGSGAAPLAKFAAVTIIGVTVTFALSSLVLRRIPLLRRIV
ncbi:MAG TPA: acyltransferase family protein, partial [Candidatus Binataceae bacterium]